MPKENKHSRGRRKEEKDKKRKRDTGDEDIVLPKRQKSQDPEDPSEEVEFIGLDNSILPQNDDKAPATERPFYGMLEDEEQEYFRRADELLELNDFPSEEERTLFLESVYREAEGKELKIACSQSCSRLMERLILLSSSAQKKKLFGVFEGNFSHLVQHRFASHCAEMLFIQSAPVVTRELTGDEVVAEKKEKAEDDAEDTEDPESLSMESLFLATLDELEGQMTFLLTDRFASHTLRVLLVILSGRPLEKSSTSSLLKSKKKEKTVVANMAAAPVELSLHKRAVPESFQFAVEKIISDTIATMDPTFIQVLATHPTGNPTLQLLLELELTNPNSKKGKNADQKTIISALLPDEVGTEGSSASVFINGIIYDAIGSRLLETICTHAPGKLFKQIYKTTFKERIAGLARNEISSYVVMKVLERLSKEDLVDAVEQISPQIMGLVERSRTVIIKTLMERCHARKAVASVEALTNAIASSYGSDPSTLVLKMACITDVDALIKATTAVTPEEGAPEVSEQPEKTGTILRRVKKPIDQGMKTTPQQTHGSLLAQSLLAIPGPPTTLIQNSLLCLPQPTLVALALYTPTSHIIQAALNPITPTLFRRKFINTLLFSTEPETPELDPTLILALSTTGSHTLDALLKSTASTAPLFILCERVALTLCNHEVALRENFTGRIIWRNYHLDLFKRRRGEWVNTVKALGAAAYPSVEPPKDVEAAEATPTTKAQQKNKKKNNDNKDNKRQPWKGNDDELDVNGNKKSKIQLARERHAKNKATGGAPGNANNIKVGSSKVGAAKDGEQEKGIEDMVHPARRVAV